MADHRHSDKIENHNSNTSQDEVGQRLLSDAQPANPLARAEQQTQQGDATKPVQTQLDVSHEGEAVKSRFDATPQQGLDQSATRINDMRTSMSNSKEGTQAWDDFVKSVQGHYPAELLKQMGVTSDSK